MIDAFERGADGILILGCPEGDCHYQDGNFEVKKRVFILRKMLESVGIEKERIRIELAVDPEGSRIQKIVKEMTEDLAKLGPAKKGIPVRKTTKKETVKAGGRK